MADIEGDLPKQRERLQAALAAYGRTRRGVMSTHAAVIRGLLVEADAATASGDTVRILRAYIGLKECAG